jgi:hypothetical protein
MPKRIPKRIRTTPTSSPEIWVSGAEAQRILNVSNWYSLHKLVMLGLVRMIADAGCPMRYHAEDCAKYRRERPVTPSRSQTVGA